MSKKMDIEEFRAEGYLQESNRRFFHPLGLSLEATRTVAAAERLHVGVGGAQWITWLIDRAVDAGIVGEDDEGMIHMREAIAQTEIIGAGEVWLTGVHDDRDDPEGVYFAPEPEPHITSDGVTLVSEAERVRKAENIDRIWWKRAAARREALGYMVQPISSIEA